ncbi:MAG TPA: DUF2202 domain-containing protein [Bacteroidales bacterium]|nr:DUF2202 domain-containing protein [Bacteroidales bacterium]
MKTTFSKIVTGSFIAIAAMTMSSCEKDLSNSENMRYASIIDVAGDGTTSVMHSNMQQAFVETAALTETELASLVKIKDEEKLARDVYAALYQKWASPVFSRITNAENNHLSAINLLLAYYGSSDTLIGEVGVFTNAEVQALYNNLVSAGSTTIEDAYKTGALIEEMDINDLQNVIATTSNANITMVMENLERGSRNHLRAFNKQLVTLGITYVPTYISQSAYDQIVNSSIEKGKNYMMQGNGKGHGKGKGKMRNGNGDGSCNN